MFTNQGFESDGIHASALLVQDYSHHYSHWDAKESLADWLKRENIPGLTGFDTRMLTRKIRSKGAMLARIEFEGKYVLVKLYFYSSLRQLHLYVCLTYFLSTTLETYVSKVTTHSFQI